MRIVRRGLLFGIVIILLLLAMENFLAFLLMFELGVPRSMGITAVEFLVFATLAIFLIWRNKLWRFRMRKDGGKTNP